VGSDVVGWYVGSAVGADAKEKQKKFRVRVMVRVRVTAKKKQFLAGNTETAAQNNFFVSYKTSWNSSKTALFYCIWIFYFKKN
jgi:hypothetical protein